MIGYHRRSRCRPGGHQCVASKEHAAEPAVADVYGSDIDV